MRCAATRAAPRRPAPRGARGCAGCAFEVAADVPTHSLVLRGPPETIDAVLDVVSEIDRVPASVRVEITVAAVDLDDRLTLGIDYLIALTNPKDPRGSDRGGVREPERRRIQRHRSGAERRLPFVATFTGEPLLIPIMNPVTGEPTRIREGGSITMNGRTVNSEVLMRPNLLITSGDEHEIFAGDNVPIPVAASGTGPEPPPGTEPPEPEQPELEPRATRRAGPESAATSGIGNAAPDDGSETGGTGTGIDRRPRTLREPEHRAQGRRHEPARDAYRRRAGRCDARAPRRGELARGVGGGPGRRGRADDPPDDDRIDDPARGR